MARGHHFDVGLQKNAANYTPLTRLSLLARTAYVYPRRPALIHGERTLNGSEVHERCRRLADASVLLTDREFSPIIAQTSKRVKRRPLV
jgi:fatty-acyl-CoA synthase